VTAPAGIEQSCDRVANFIDAAVMGELAPGSTEEKLGVKLPTVHTYVRRVCDKFAIRSRAERPALLAKLGFDANPQSDSF
jgi:hypothetical protein